MKFSTQYIKNHKSVLNRLKTANFKGAFFFAIFLVLISASYNCANIQQPMGGPIDSIPPKILQEQPANLQVNFADKKIVLTFDEFIRITNPNKEVSISPDMETFPKITANRKQVEIELPENLEAQTTYVINFGKAIVDNNEGNPLENYSYVFSTGDKIDSLSISGKVINALTNEPEIQTSVILIPVAQDSIFGKRKANIFATTDSTGNFKLNYLRPDTYRIYALKEQNNDRIYNSPDEWIGFLKDSIELTKDTSGLQLLISKEIPAKTRIIDRNLDGKGALSLTFNQELFDPILKIVNPDSLDQNKLVHFNSKKDSAIIWLSSLTFDSVKVKLFDKEEFLDSMLLRRPSSDKYNRTMLLTTNLLNNKVNRVKHLRLFSSSPIEQLNRNKISLLEDSILVNNYQLARDTSDNRILTIRYGWKAGKNYELKLEEDAIQNKFLDKNELVSFKFTFDETDRYGDLTIKSTLPDSNQTFIVELIDENNTKIVANKTITTSENIEFKNIQEGKYRIRFIYDENKNGRWDPGNLTTKTAPEKIWYYEKVFNIRPNWEQEETISVPNQDAPRQLLPLRKK